MTIDNHNKYVVLIIADETGCTPAGASFEWGRNASARSALSPYGEEIPVPLFAVAIPLAQWRDKWEAVFRYESSSNHCKLGYCYKMRASLRPHLTTLFNTYETIWTGVSTEIAYDENGTRNHGYGGEVVTTGKSNHGVTVFDGMIQKRFGWSVRECRAQIKYLGCWFYPTDAPDGHCKRGARGGYVSANSTSIDELLNA